MQFSLATLLTFATAASAAAIVPVLPIADLKCSSPKHACNVYHQYPFCSATYVMYLTKCMQSGCIAWIRDPLEDCRNPPVDA